MLLNLTNSSRNVCQNFLQSRARTSWETRQLTIYYALFFRNYRNIHCSSSNTFWVLMTDKQKHRSQHRTAYRRIWTLNLELLFPTLYLHSPPHIIYSQSRQGRDYIMMNFRNNNTKNYRLGGVDETAEMNWPDLASVHAGPTARYLGTEQVVSISETGDEPYWSRRKLSQRLKRGATG